MRSLLCVCGACGLFNSIHRAVTTTLAVEIVEVIFICNLGLYFSSNLSDSDVCVAYIKTCAKHFRNAYTLYIQRCLRRVCECKEKKAKILIKRIYIPFLFRFCEYMQHTCESILPCVFVASFTLYIYLYLCIYTYRNLQPAIKTVCNVEKII